MNNQIVPGSISAIAAQNHSSIAESFLSAEAIVIVDTSGSMGSKDSRGGRERYEVACEELITLQKNRPGKIAVISFSDDAMFCPAGVPVYLKSGTDLAKALRFVKVADLPGMQFILISDGQPGDEQSALSVAMTFKSKIDVIYVGPEDHPAGREFLFKLAKATGGKAVSIDRAKELQAGFTALLPSGH